MTLTDGFYFGLGKMFAEALPGLIVVSLLLLIIAGSWALDKWRRR